MLSTFVRGRFQYGELETTQEPIQEDCHFLSEYLKVVCFHDILPINWMFELLLEMYSMYFSWQMLSEGWHIISNWCKTYFARTMYCVILILGIVSVVSIYFLCCDVQAEVDELLINCQVCNWTSWIYPLLLPAAIATDKPITCDCER